MHMCRSCTREYNRKRYEDSKGERYTTPWHCEVCKLYFASEQWLKIHTEEHHREQYLAGKTRVYKEVGNA